MKQFKYFGEDSGFCRIDYKYINDKGQVFYYCFQDEGENYGGIRFLRCTQDGEPSHEVTPREWNFEPVKGNSELANKVREFILKKQSEVKK